MPAESAALTRDERVENLVINYPMLLMGSFEGAFASLASKMGEALVEGSAAVAAAFAGGASGSSGGVDASKDTAAKPEDKIGSQVSQQVKGMFAGMRGQIRAEITLSEKRFRKFIRDPAFDEGLKIVERHDFGLPRLTERLSDDQLASYLVLLSKENPESLKMMQELSEWQEKAPKFKNEDK